MTMEYSRSDDPQGLRRSVGEATERIHEIIDAAERVASDIRRDAEAEASRYLDERRREADRLAEERNAALDQLTNALSDAAEEFKQRAERMLADLDRAIADARAGVGRQAPSAPAPSVPERPEPFGEQRDQQGGSPLGSLGGSDLDFGSPAPKLSPDDPFELPPLEHQPVAGLPDPEPPREREPDRPMAAVSAYPGRGEPWQEERPGANADTTSEALLRATQLAVTGKDRNEIAAVLRADFPGVDAEPLLDEILG